VEEDALRLEHGSQSPLGIAVYPMNECEDLGLTLLRDAPSDDDLEAAARPHECQMLRCGTAGEQRERVGIGAWDLFERDFRHSIRKTARW
jgi:hypothetical protein